MRKADGFAHALPAAMVFGCFGVGAALQTLAMKRSELSVNYILVLGLEAALALLLSIGWLGEAMSPRKLAGLALILAGVMSLRLEERPKTPARAGGAHAAASVRTGARRSAPQGHAAGRAGHPACARAAPSMPEHEPRSLPVVGQSTSRSVGGAVTVRRRAFRRPPRPLDRPWPRADRSADTRGVVACPRPALPGARAPARARTRPPRAGRAPAHRRRNSRAPPPAAARPGRDGPPPPASVRAPRERRPGSRPRGGPADRCRVSTAALASARASSRRPRRKST